MTIPHIGRHLGRVYPVVATEVFSLSLVDLADVLIRKHKDGALASKIWEEMMWV